MKKDRPAHVIGPDDRRTLCGIGPNDPRRFPYVSATAVAKHVAGYGMTVCPQCAAILRKQSQR